MNKIDPDIRNKIIITDKINTNYLVGYSNIELAAIYSKNENNFNILKSLLEYNKDITKINKILRKTAQHLNTTASYDAFKLLLDYGADINHKKYTDITILMISCMNVHETNIEIINFLIDNGSDVNIKSDSGVSALSLLINFSSTNEHLEIIKLLIKKGGHVNSKDKNFQTPLMKRILSYNSIINLNYLIDISLDIIKLLLDNSADVYIKDKNHKNIFDIVKDTFGENSAFYSLIFNYKNLVGDHFCDFDVYFIYQNL